MAVIIKFLIGLNAGIELRIAHHKQVSDSLEMTFPNQSLLPVYVEKNAYINDNEFKSVKLVKIDDGEETYWPYVVEVEIRTSASKKLNHLAAQEERLGVGVFKYGKPVQLIQLVQEVEDNKMWWTGFETEAEAQEILDLFQSSEKDKT